MVVREWKTPNLDILHLGGVFLKRIAVQEGLEEIKQGLENKGYEVVNQEDSGHIDAIVYENTYEGMQNLNSSMDSNMYGAILINSKNKTIEEIEYIIETRRYETLFTR